MRQRVCRFLCQRCSSLVSHDHISVTVFLAGAWGHDMRGHGRRMHAGPLKVATPVARPQWLRKYNAQPFLTGFAEKYDKMHVEMPNIGGLLHTTEELEAVEISKFQTFAF